MRVVNKTALVFGGTGYLGSHIVVQLYQKGFQITLAEHPMLYDHNNLIGLSDLCNGQIKLSLLDWSDEDAVAKLLNSNAPIDAIVFAGNQYFEDQIGDSILTSNHFHIDSALSVFSVIEKQLTVPLILLSSYKVYGNSRKQHLKEDFKLLKGRNDEIELNALMEQFLLLSSLSNDLTIARMALPLGAHESLKIGLPIASFFSEYHQKIKDSIYSGLPFQVKYRKEGQSIVFEAKDFIHVVDGAEAIALIVENKILQSKRTSAIYNVASNQAFPVNRLAKALKFFSANQFEIREGELAINDNLFFQLANSKIIAETGWFIKHQLIDAIKSHCAYLNKHNGKSSKAA